MKIEKLFSFNKRERGPELESFLESFDFGALQELFDEEFKRAGVSKKPSIVPADKFDENRSIYGQYWPEDKSASVNISNIKELAGKTGVEWEMLAQKILIHEQIHAATDQDCTQDKWHSEERQIGYSRLSRIKKTPIGEGLYFLWNEGVTETWARELFRAYLLKTRGKSEKEIDIFFEKIAAVRKTGIEHPYEDEIDFVDAFISRLEKETGVEREKIQKAVIHGMIRGESFTEPEFEELAEDIFPEGFLEDLEKARSHNTIRRLTKELSSGSPAGLRSFKRFIENYMESMGKTH